MTTDRTNAERQRRYITNLKAKAAAAEKTSVSNVKFPAYHPSAKGIHDIAAKQISDWLKAEMDAGRISPLSMQIIGSNATFFAEQAGPKRKKVKMQPAE